MVKEETAEGIHGRATAEAGGVHSFKKLNPGHAGAQPGDVHRRDGAVVTTYYFCKHIITGEGTAGLHRAGFAVAVVHGALRQFRGSGGGGPGAAQAEALQAHPGGDHRQAAQEDGEREADLRRRVAKGRRGAGGGGDIIPGDGEIVEGIASVDESAITGESAPVIRESGGDFCSVTGGTKVLSDQIKVHILADPGQSFLDKMIALVEGAERQDAQRDRPDHPAGRLTIIFLVVISWDHAHQPSTWKPRRPVSLVALLVCLIPTTIGGLLSAIGIAGMDRLMQYNVLAMSGRAVEAAGDVNTLLLDKTGTITFGNRFANEFLPFEAPHGRKWEGRPCFHPWATARRRAAPSSPWAPSWGWKWSGGDGGEVPWSPSRRRRA